MRLHISGLALLGSVILAGCSGSVHKQVNLENGQGLALSAEQRIVTSTNKGGREGNRHIVCAEPSPDAIMVAAFSGALQGNLANGAGAGGAVGGSEAAASLALRTQTIQLLRDGYYRLCEAYSNGAISREQYNFALVNIDHLILPAMIVDAVAGTGRAPAVAIAAGVPGASTTSSQTQGDDSAEASRDATVTGGATSVEIEELNVTRTPLSKDETALLSQVIKLVEDGSTISLCMSYLSDSGFLHQENDLPVPPEKAATLTLCSDLIATLAKRDTKPSSTPAAAAAADAAKAHAVIEKAIKNLNASVKANPDAIKASERDATIKLLNDALLRSVTPPTASPPSR